MISADLMANHLNWPETNRGVCALDCSCCQERGADYDHRDRTWHPEPLEKLDFK